MIRFKTGFISRILSIGVLFLCSIYLSPDAFGTDDKIPVKDIFVDTQAVAYVIWPCKIDDNLVKETGQISEIDLLALKRPSVFGNKETYQRWFEHYPCFPFDFKTDGKKNFIKNLRSNELILNNSVYEGLDEWGNFIACRGKQFPDIEVRRYPTFVTLISNRIDKPLSSKHDYSVEIDSLLKAFKIYFLDDNSISNLFNTVKDSYAIYKYPVVIVTHINSHEKFDYLGHLVEGMRVDEYWTIEELIQMGVVPHDGYNFTMSMGSDAFIAHHQINGLVRIIVLYKPPMIDMKHWRMANPINRDVERLIRFLSFIHVVLPEYIKGSQRENDKDFDSLIRALSINPSKANIDKTVKKFNTIIQDQEGLLRKLKILSEKIEQICTILDDATLWESKAVNKGDFDFYTKEFGKKHNVPLREADLESVFIRFALRYDIGPNHEYDTRKILKEKRNQIKDQIVKIETNIERNIKPRFEQQLNFATATYTLKENIKWSLIILALSLIFGNLLFTIFDEDLKRKNICPKLLKLWQKGITNIKKLEKLLMTKFRKPKKKWKNSVLFTYQI
ncbi:MAG: hypothetical protein WC510_01765 [Candidatus Omnitrophota bacterium]